MKFHSRGIYEYFHEYFGDHYIIFVVCLCHSIIFNLAVALSWTSPVLAKLEGTKDNPLGNPITPEESDLIGSLMYIGAAFGPLLFIPSAEYFGRKNTLLFLSIIPPLTFGTYLFAETVELFYVCRILQGIFVGGVISVQPVYLAELLAEQEKVFYMSLCAIFASTGILTVNAVGSFVPFRYFNGLFFIIGLSVFLLLFLGCPNTPFYVMKTEGLEATKKLLMILRKQYKSEEADEIFKTIESEVRNSFFEVFSSRNNMQIFLIATVPVLLQQFSGNLILLTYNQLIFEKSGISLKPAVCSIIIEIFDVLTSFSAPLILKYGKPSIKALFAACLGGMGICNFVLSFYFYFLINNSSFKWILLVFFILSINFFNSGVGTIPWIYMGQIYPKNISSVGCALSTSIFFVSSFPSLFFFSKVNIGFLFLLSAVFCTLGVPYILLFFVEPRKKGTQFTKDICINSCTKINSK